MTVKFAVITDIHANNFALDAALTEIESIGVDHIYCLGDLVGIGPNHNEVLERIFSLDDITIISGNHDQAIVALAAGEYHHKGHEHAKRHHGWVYKTLDKGHIKSLRELPLFIEKRYTDINILATHYNIEEEKLKKSYYNPYSDIVEPALENLEKLFQKCNHDLIMFGHHHPKHFFISEQKIYLNPGSLGCNPAPYARYAIVEINKCDINVEYLQAEYNRIDLIKSYDKVPEKEFLLKAFHGIN
ncbi:MAG: YfcE family phosphodiesterase [Bacillales bacterium]|jgi:putative phosphoesterase|nr:YfcE family phosphodiesterase [Bacillales bacterium]